MRSWHRLALEVDPGLIVVSGPNGAGKTSMVEAIALGLIGVSPRTSREAEVVRAGCQALHVTLEVDGPQGRARRDIGFQPGLGRRMRLDEVPNRSLAAWRAPGSVLVFLPEELRAVKGPPAARRRVIDRLVEGIDPTFVETAAAYSSAVSQRNALLKRIRAGAAGPAGLPPWDHAVAEFGARIAVARSRAVDQLSPRFAAWLAELGGGAGGRLVLESSPAARADVADDDVESFLAERLVQTRERDVGAAQTLSGPHRDDVWIGVGDQDLRRTGSQGEQRTAVLAILLACRDHLAEHRVAPILLLDDVLSELDPDRRRRLLTAVADGGQAWVTTADPDAASLATATGARHLLRVRPGVVDVE